ncbi:MAG: PstS family phosphate ABC transporter substrate-binding protein [Bacteroidota bacterium]
MRFFAILLLIYFSSCTANNDTIKIKGSDTEVNLAVVLTEQFHKENDAILISVSGGGSGLGIASLLNGNTDIANSSRSIKQTELDLFQQKNIELDSFVFAKDAIAFVVSDKLIIDSISTRDIAKILNGEINNWSSLHQKNMPITIYGRQSNSGTYDYVKHILNIHFSPYAKQMNGNAQILEAIKSDASGMGYVSAGYVLKGSTTGIKVLSVYTDQSNAVSPFDAAAIASGTYYFQRPLFQYFRKNDYPKIKPFFDFEKSAIGAKIIQESGYYPIKK